MLPHLILIFMLILRIHRYYIINLVSQNSKLITCSFKENSSLISDSSGIILSTKQHVWARHTVAYNHICLGCYLLKGTPDQKQITCNQINNSLKTTGIQNDRSGYRKSQPYRRQLPESGGLCPITPCTIDV